MSTCRPPRRGRARWLTPFAALVIAAACGSTGPPTLPPTASPSASPTPSASPGPAASPTPSPSPAAALALAPLDADLRDRFAATVQADQAALGWPAVQVYVRYAGGFGWSGAAGYADVAAGRAVGPADVFDVGSVTKTFIAALTLKLAEAGVLSLDDRLSRWLPSYPGAAGITLRQLLSHTSGLADYFDNATLLKRLGAAPRQLWTPAQLLPYVGAPLFAPGHDYAYSNTNFLLLGMVLRLATGGSIGTALQTAFFAPLGMSRTVFQTDQRVSPPFAVPYDYKSGGRGPLVALGDGSGWLPFASLASSLNTAGAIVADARDLATWAAALYGGDVLSPASLEQMLDFALTEGYQGDFVYGLGAQRTILDGQTTVGHSGRCSGYRATMRYLPAFGLTIVVLTNLNGPDPDRIVSDLIAAALTTPCSDLCRLTRRL